MRTAQAVDGIEYADILDYRSQNWYIRDNNVSVFFRISHLDVLATASYQDVSGAGRIPKNIAGNPGWLRLFLIR